MTQYVCTAAAMRAAEQEFFDAHPDTDLMAVAAQQVAAQARSMLADLGCGVRGGSVLVLVGGGNNGGDGLLAAAELADGGCHVRVCPVLGTPHAAGWQAALRAGCEVVTMEQAGQVVPDLVIDAVLGIGGRPGVPDDLAGLGEQLSAASWLAVDLPSGLDANSGAVTTSLRADVTVTFAARKWCHVAPPAAERCGRVDVVDIGVEPGGSDGVPKCAEGWTSVVDEDDLARLWPVPGPGDDKYSRGVVGMDTGSSQYPGAAVLGTLGALRTGAGMVRYVGPRRPADLVLAAMPSVVLADGRVQAWVVGSGWGQGDPAANGRRLQQRCADGVPMVIDADALSLLPAELPDGCLLTPHAGELARMLGVDRDEVRENPRESAAEAARRFGATVLLKGAIQWVADPNGHVVEPMTSEILDEADHPGADQMPAGQTGCAAALPGPAWTGQAGSGDVLAGVCGTLLAAGVPAGWAGLLGASLQALTVCRHPGPWSPDQLAEFFPEIIGAFRWPQLSVSP